ncbi:TetR/AcrR family transcriptional regulator [Methylobacterium brachythecii]|uniref:TetR family transcriptional regulator n=1 Tax=Methylobacterium brachythecii TaxID=1176177 RepID=A0A7W6F8U7_9HYPH|nr:TetR family transcriptional regulator [Methylobacterium brachythecii]MBB3904833.1 TetR/AcrR family transcriptional repressor of nem operon [Methylobacterium brachythecii]GLS45385.1 TetR family transcriptional regulator [Methylobacterium brachythecii]
MPKVSQEQARLNRQRVVEVAAALFRERGLHGIGVADIMSAAGLTHGGFYGQFANKDALAAEAFDSALAEEYRGSVDTIIANYLSLAHVKAPGKGCPLAALANDVAREPLGSVVRSRFTRGVERLAAILAELTPRSSKERRRRRSLSTLSTLVGAIVLARAVDDETLASDLIEAAKASVTS